MALEALAAALVLAIFSVVGSALALAAWNRLREPRFLLVAAGQWALLAMGAIWAYGQVAATPPSYAAASLPVVGLAALASVLLVLGSLWPPRS